MIHSIFDSTRQIHDTSRIHFSARRPRLETIRFLPHGGRGQEYAEPLGEREHRNTRVGRALFINGFGDQKVSATH